MSASPVPAINLRSISKSFRKNPFWPWGEPDRVQALRDVTLSVSAGSLLALVGPNGAGKTTLLRIISTLLLPDRGDGNVSGFPLSDSPRIRQTISLAMGEERGFYGRLTVRQNLDFFCRLYGLHGHQIPDKIRELSDLFELKDILHQPYERLSTGTKQRVVLARCLLNKATLLLADEPTRSLDVENKGKIQSWLRKLSREFGLTVVFTTHDLTEAKALGDNIVQLKEGVLQALS
jgi:ABC-2 type transport system ATP-binding protein